MNDRALWYASVWLVLVALAAIVVVLASGCLHTELTPTLADPVVKDVGGDVVQETGVLHLLASVFTRNVVLEGDGNRIQTASVWQYCALLLCVCLLVWLLTARRYRGCRAKTDKA